MGKGKCTANNRAPLTLESKLDASVNFIEAGEFPGLIEARYVRRCEENFIVYLSSQTGCNKACRFCHLTQTGQTRGVDLNLEAYFRQARQVLSHYDSQIQKGVAPARTVNYNFMSRGEVFANQLVLNQGDPLVQGLAELANSRGLIPRFKFSTIMPRELEAVEFAEIFKTTTPDLYYSLYSLDPKFRRRWLPKALDPNLGLEKLVDWQEVSRKVPVLHWALIEGENDDARTILDIANKVNQVGLRCDFNLVRYNPFSEAQGREPAGPIIERAAKLLSEAVPGCRVKIVGRVGHDVKASCGMFVAGPDAKRPLKELPVLPSTPSRVVKGGG